MDTYKVEILTWTSSFRYPNILSGYQPTLDVPPISTVLGLINAASGNYREYQNLRLGYFFQYEFKGTDIETIYMIEGNGKGKATNNAKSNIIKREILFNNKLILYLEDEELANKFRHPVFPLLLGRSNDLASVISITPITLELIEKASKIKGQLVPFNHNFLPGQIQALPKYFTDTIPRNSIGTEPYTIIPFSVSDFETNITAFRDITLLKSGVDIYYHKIIFGDYGITG